MHVPKNQIKITYLLYISLCMIVYAAINLIG